MKIPEKIIRTYKHKGAVIELVERPETIYAGKSVFTDNLADGWGERLAGSHTDDFGSVISKAQPEYDVHVSINFWSFSQTMHPGVVFGRQVASEEQPDGVDVYKVPASLYLRVYTDRAAARLIGKDACEPWELFAYFLHRVMPKYGFVKPAGADHQIEIYESVGHGDGWAYVAAERKKRRPSFRKKNQHPSPPPAYTGTEGPSRSSVHTKCSQT